MRPGLLDRYLLGAWIRIFLLSAVGLPLVAVLLELTDRLNKLLVLEVSAGAIALSSLYGLPEAMAQMMPAAALFATVFTIGPFSRHSELTAAKAVGLSFRRLMLPLLGASIVAAGLAWMVGEYATEAKTRQLELREERQARSVSTRFNFVFLADSGWTYAVSVLDTEKNRMIGLVLDQTSRRSEVPSRTVIADSATWIDSTGWTLWHGATHLIPAEGAATATGFERMQLQALDEAPRDLLLESRDPAEMAWGELGRYIAMLRRSNNDTRKLEVKRALKIALPAACFVIALFAAPLAITSPRAGPAAGVAIGLGTTVAYLLLINLTQAFGSGGLVDPTLAAWMPNILFFAVGTILMARVRT